MKTETGRKKRRCCFQIAFRLGLQYRLLSESPVCQPTLQNLDMLAYMITWSLKCIYTHIYICVCIDPPPTHTQPVGSASPAGWRGKYMVSFWPLHFKTFKALRFGHHLLSQDWSFHIILKAALQPGWSL